jgi:hypothetical protein
MRLPTSTRRDSGAAWRARAPLRLPCARARGGTVRGCGCSACVQSNEHSRSTLLRTISTRTGEYRRRGRVGGSKRAGRWATRGTMSSTLSTHTGYSEYSHGRSAGGRKQAHRSMGTPELFTFVPARWRDDSPLLPIPMNGWSPPPASPACAAPARNPRRCGRTQTSGAYVGQRAHSPSADVGRVPGRQH